MSTGYVAVQWSRAKRVYDGVVAGAVLLYLGAFAGVTLLVQTGDRSPSGPVLAMRATGSCVLVLLHVILCIGPLARIDRRMAAILYNRRHLGVATFLVALVHAVIAVGFYHGFGDLNPLVSVLGINPNFLSVRAFPFQVLGVLGLAVLFLMAATSHDFWLRNLSPASWKRLHMLVYPAYVLLVGHAALGALQNDRGPAAAAALAAGVLTVCGLHLATGLREAARDRGGPTARDGWVDAGPADTIEESRARTVCTAGGERIAVFKHGGKLSAVSNLCAHQGGPLGEGKVIDGCITCPWHGWQYRPGDGCSPPPFKEKIATYQVRVVRGRVEVNPRALPPGTATAPVEEAPHG